MLRIGQVTILVEGYDVGIDFFVNRLGFELMEDTALNDEKRSHIGLQAGGRVAFFLHTDDLHTDEFNADQARIAAAGVRFPEAPRTEAYGKVAVFENRSGNQWDLIQLNA